ncbi:MAG: 3-hydroxyacyl-ACP dehydratase FabZ [Tissierellales bacterium]|nr:3-hydroxyacyl-ACP dehydratase FabZ [Tissierellales bacterium]
MTSFDINEIMNILPHRFPFLFVDRVEVDDEGLSGKGYKNVTINESYFQGHFPNNPVMPGVILIETMAQVGAVIILSKDEYKGKTAYFAGVNNFRFKEKVLPGDTLEIEVNITRVRGSIGVGEGVAYVRGKKAASGEFMFAIG